MKKYQNLLLYPNQRRPIDRANCRQVAALLTKLGYTLYTCDPACVFDELQYAPVETAFGECDAVIVLGGDGTMLGAAAYAQKTGIPLLGINFGTLGYMTELSIDEIHLLEHLEDAKIEERMMLDACVKCGDTESTITALNECAICRSKPGTMIRVYLFCDGNMVSSYRCDGMIISTPTGTSAYNLSAGGPIIDPKLNAFCVSPLAPHSLSAIRPLVFAPDSVLRVEVEGVASVTADSSLFPEIVEKGTVTIQQSERTVKLLKLKNAGFYEALMEKLT